LGLLVGLLPLLTSATFRKIIHTTPGTRLIGVQAIRLGGFFFFTLFHNPVKWYRYQVRKMR
jgi:hypothetical protein